MPNQLTLQCDKCNELTPHTPDAPNHVLHAILSLLTLGVWLIIWLIVAMAPVKQKCAKCGRERMK